MRHDHIKEICNKSAHHALKGTNAAYSNPQKNIIMNWMGVESMVFKDADNHNDWKSLRRLASPSFTSINVKKLRAPTSKVHARCMDFLAESIKKTGANEPYGIEPFIFALTFDVLGESSFSQDFGGIRALDGGDQHTIVKAFHYLCEASTDRRFDRSLIRPWLKPNMLWIPTKANREFVRQRDLIRAAVEEIIATREKLNKSNNGKKHNDFLQTMLDAYDDEAGTRFTRNQLRDNLITILFGGYDTTGITLLYLLYRLAKHPDVQQKVFEEIEKVLPNGAPPTDDTYNQLQYTQLVVKETLRLHAPAHVTIRCCQEDIQAGKFLFKKGTVCFIPLYDAMRCELNYTNALEFRPERHLEEESISRLHAFMPFVRGQRTCIGQRFAEMSAAMTIAALVQRFEFRLPDDYVMEMRVTNPTQRPKDPLRLQITERTRAEFTRKN